MKQIFLFLLCLFIGIVAIFSYRQYTIQLKTAPVKNPLSQTTPFSLATPPKEAQRGTIVSFSGGVQLQTRAATEPAALVNNPDVLQGEEYWTGSDGVLQIRFPNILEISIFADTHISFIQTLPKTFVMKQDSGEVEYTNLGQNNPVSIRIFHLLIQQDNGVLNSTIDDTSGLIILTVEKGSITVAFNDTDNISQVLAIEEGNTYTFDDASRTGEVSISE